MTRRPARSRDVRRIASTVLLRCRAWTHPIGSTTRSPRRATTTRSSVEGAAVHYLRWGARDRPGIVLVHGGAAHAHWWDHVAPLLAQECCVVALDLSGHGDSGRRDRYPTSTWAEEVVAVAEHAGIAGPPIVVAHSMGGWVAITAAAEHGDRLDGIVVLDSPVSRHAPGGGGRGRGRRVRAAAHLPDARGRARPLPHGPRPADVAAVRARPRRPHVGAQGRRRLDVEVRPADLRPPGPDRRAAPAGAVPDGAVPLRARARDRRTSARTCTSSSGRIAPVVEVPLAHHHVMLDQPIPLVTGLRTLLADWEHSRPSAPHLTGSAPSSTGTTTVVGRARLRLDARPRRPPRRRTPATDQYVSNHVGPLGEPDDRPRRRRPRRAASGSAGRAGAGATSG